MTAQAQPGFIEKSIPCIARQPILTADENVIGYELFLREDQSRNSSTTDADKEAAATIDMLNLVGLGVLCDGRLAFINCTHNMLLSDYLALLPPSDVVVELQSDIPANEKVILKCQELKRAGYSIALDNFVPGDRREALIPYTRFLKIDITGLARKKARCWPGSTPPRTAGWWRKKWKQGNSSWRLKRAVLRGSRDIFFAFPRICEPGRFPRARPPTCAC